MGYTTTFSGEFNVSPPLKPEHLAYLKQFAETRRVKRDAVKAERLPDPLRLAAGLPIGTDGAYFVGGFGDMGQGLDDSVIDGNKPPGSPPELCKACGRVAKFHYCQNHGEKNPCGSDWGQHLGHGFQMNWAAWNTAKRPDEQPGLWCQWVPTDDGTAIVWDEGEKFYEYVEWMQYLLDHFLTPWGYMVAGIVYWEGEESGDMGRIVIDSPTHRVKTQAAQITYGP